MKERPILFQGAMVRAILAGTKTQTRRAVRPQPSSSSDTAFIGADGIWRFSHPTARGPVSHEADDVRCPYGKPGDRLWVRETWQGPLFDHEQGPAYRSDPAAFQKPKFCRYAADGGPAPEFVDEDDNLRCCWRPSIFMPRWACRLVLEVVSVRVERLQDISEADAIAEGYPGYGVDGIRWSARHWYELLWDEINGAGSWAANPWVWVVEFKRADAQASRAAISAAVAL